MVWARAHVHKKNLGSNSCNVDSGVVEFVDTGCADPCFCKEWKEVAQGVVLVAG